MTPPTIDTGGTARRTTAPDSPPNGQHPSQMLTLEHLSRETISPIGRTERLMRVQVCGAASGPGPQRSGSLTTGPWSLDADGRSTALSAAVLLDNTLAKAVHAAAPGLDWIVTTELQLNFTGPLPPDGAVLEAWTQAITVDRLGGASRGTLRGPGGVEYAHATGWFQAVDTNSEESLEHYERQAALPLGPETEATMPALLGLRADTPRREDARPSVTEDFQPGVAFEANDSLKNPHGATHGGALTMMAGLAAQQAMPDRTGYELQSLQVRFLRPASGAIATRTRVRHAGRSLRIVEVELLADHRVTGPGQRGLGADVGHPRPAKPFVQATAAFRAAR